MAPNLKNDILHEEIDEQVTMVAPQAAPRKYTIVYPMVLTLVYWHIGLLYGLYLAFTSAKWATIIFNLLIFVAKGFGVTAGAHRLWAHRAYKAKLPLQILLMLLQTLSHQNTVFNWVTDHRLHHKYCDTDTDPHNSTRGFFYSHIGWLMVEKHPDAIKRGRTIDMSDLLENPVLQFQKKHKIRTKKDNFKWREVGQYPPAPDCDKMSTQQTPPAPRKYTLVYPNIFYLLYWHIGALYGLYLGFTSAKWATIIFNVILYICAMLGLTAGAHRLWAHHAYKAKLPLQIVLMLFHSLTFQHTVFDWVRNHRAHHKFYNTDADPHNPQRGFFFTHFGWLLVRQHPEVIEKGKTIDMSDIFENPVLHFQHKHSYICTLLAFVLPTLIPIYCWQETLNIAYHVGLVRHVCSMNAIMFTNSAAHRYGFKPYDKHMSSPQSPTLSIATLGESFHNYHHVYPFDCRSTELGNNYINLTTKFIDFFAWIGWAYDIKYAPDEMIAKRAERTGDGSDLWGRGKEDLDTAKGSKKTEDATEDSEVIWRWGDGDITEYNYMKILRSE